MRDNDSNTACRSTDRTPRKPDPTRIENWNGFAPDLFTNDSE